MQLFPSFQYELSSAAVGETLRYLVHEGGSYCQMQSFVL